MQCTPVEYINGLDAKQAFCKWQANMHMIVVSISQASEGQMNLMMQ